VLALPDCRSVSAKRNCSKRDCYTMTAKPAVGRDPALARAAPARAFRFINYLDRGNLSIAAPLLKKSSNFGDAARSSAVVLLLDLLILSAVSGWLVDRLDVKWVIAGGFFLWSAATAATGAVHAFGTLLLARWRSAQENRFLSSMLRPFVAVISGAKRGFAMRA